MRRLPLTASGLTVLLLGVVAYVTAWQLGWVELMVFAAGCLVALLVAVPFVVGRQPFDVARMVSPNRVTVGEPALASLVVTNRGHVPSVPRVVEDSVGSRSVPVEVPSLGPGRSHEAVYRLPTRRRGVVQVGPAVLARSDPLGLVRREAARTGVDHLFVHPRVLPLAALPAGFAKDLEGPTFDTSPAGDVAFHVLREYQLGDDYRHIHWLSTARTGTLMVRHYVDNRRPQLTVVLDERRSSYQADEFEVAVSIAGSLAVSCIAEQQPMALRFGSRVVVGHSRGGGREDVLDRLAMVEPADDGDLLTAALDGARDEAGTSVLVLVTGAVPAAELMRIAQVTRRSARLVVARAWPPDVMEPEVLPGAKLFDVWSVDEFRLGWNRMAT